MEVNGYKLSAQAAAAAQGRGYAQSRPAMVIRSDAQFAARAKTPGKVDALAMDAAEVYAPYKFPEGVYPGGGGLAMDSAAGLPAVSQWAISGVLHEGQGFFGYPYLAELFQRSEYRHAAEIWAEHAVRKWIEITGGEESEVEEIEAEFARLQVRDVFQEWMLHDHSFGRGQIFLDFGDADDERETAVPLLLKGEKISPKRPLKHLKVVEPLWSGPGSYSTTNPLRQDFYRPAHWFVYGRKVDASRMLTLTSRPVSDMLKPAYAFGGQSLTQLMKPYVDNWLRTRQGVSDMIVSYSVMNLKTDMSATLSGGGSEHLFARVDLFNLTRDNRGCMVTDKDNEELENLAVPLSGLSDLQSQAQEQLASVSRIPLSIYLQITPTGLNATNEGETRNFYADVKAYQEKNIRPHLQRLFEIVQLSLWGAIKPKLAFNFIDLWEMSDKDKADIRKSDADADAVYATLGAIDPDDVRSRLNDDETSNYHGRLAGAAPGPIVEEEPDDEGEEGGFAADEWNESDHPRDGQGRFGAGGGRLDHGELNVPGRLKNLERDIDKAVAFVRQQSENAFRNAREKGRAREAAARQFLADPDVDAFLKEKAKKMGKPVAELRSAVKSMSDATFAKFVEGYARETGG